MANDNDTYQDMKSAADRLKAAREEIEGNLQQRKRLVDDLVAGGYVTDSSSKAFQSSDHEYNTGATKTIEGLNGMADSLTPAADNFQRADTSSPRR